MAFTQILVLVVFAFAVDALEWKNCDEGSPVRISEIEVHPQPLPLMKGARVTVSGKFKVTDAAGTNYKLHIKVWKSLGWLPWLPIPCPEKYCVQSIGCDQIIGLLEEEQCPLAKKEYVVKQRSLVLPDLPSIIKSVLPSGKYSIRADLRDAAGNRRISCVEVEVELSNDGWSGEL